MASGRFINISVAEDERLNSISVEAQMMYLMTIPHLDRDGLINGNPKVLRGRVCPLREEFQSKMTTIINEWVQAGLVIKYTSSDDAVLWFKGFAKNNPLTHYSREKASKFAPPPGYIRDAKGLVANIDGKLPEVSGKLPDTSGDSPREVEVEVEVEVEEKAAARARVCVSEPDSDKDGRYTMQLLRDTNLFFSFGADARQKASGVEEIYAKDTICRAIDVLVERHHRMVERTNKGIHDPLSFLAKILAEDFKTAEDSRTVKVEVRMAPSEFFPNGQVVYDKMTLATARKNGFKILEYVQ